MQDLFIPTDHEHVQIKPGRRSGLPVMIAVHSTVLGPAVGGLRIQHYARSIEGLSDALRLSEAMTVKAAAVDNGTGGGKAVVPLPIGLELHAALRESILLDVAEHVHALNGLYHVAPDVGSGPTDMDVIRRRTPYAGGYSRETGGAGGTTFGTFIGVDTALREVIRQVLPSPELRGLRVAIVGLGGIGTLLAHSLAREGASLVLSDIDTERRLLADELGAEWSTPDDAMLAECDVLMPCALGGVLRLDLVPRMRCRIICGAANNQLASVDVALALHARGITYIPDFIANAGGLLYASDIGLRYHSEQEAAQHTRDRIERNVRLLLQDALQTGATTLAAALGIANVRLKSAQHQT